MKATYTELIKIEADNDKWLDWKEPRYTTDENGNEVREYLKAKTVFLGYGDKISNYVEVDAEGNITELDESNIVKQ